MCWMSKYQSARAAPEPNNGIRATLGRRDPRISRNGCARADCCENLKKARKQTEKHRRRLSASCAQKEINCNGVGFYRARDATRPQFLKTIERQDSRERYTTSREQSRSSGFTDPKNSPDAKPSTGRKGLTTFHSESDTNMLNRLQSGHT
jgi:hypothetical protein